MRVFALLRPPFPVDDLLVGTLLQVSGDAMDVIESGASEEAVDAALAVIGDAFDQLQDLGYVVYWEY